MIRAIIKSRCLNLLREYKSEHIFSNNDYHRCIVDYNKREQNLKSFNINSKIRQRDTRNTPNVIKRKQWFGNLNRITFHKKHIK